LRALSTTGGAGGVLDIFYSAWKMRLHEHKPLFDALCDLWAHTYGADDGDDAEVDDGDDAEVDDGDDDECDATAGVANLYGDDSALPPATYTHPHGRLNHESGYIYVNRVCYRLPDALSEMHATRGANAAATSSSAAAPSAFSSSGRPLQRCLAPHVDCCPMLLYGYDDDVESASENSTNTDSNEAQKCDVRSDANMNGQRTPEEIAARRRQRRKAAKAQRRKMQRKAQKPRPPFPRWRPIQVFVGRLR
jgi:hypothetical protein